MSRRTTSTTKLGTVRSPAKRTPAKRTTSASASATKATAPVSAYEAARASGSSGPGRPETDTSDTEDQDQDSGDDDKPRTKKNDSDQEDQDQDSDDEPDDPDNVMFYRVRQYNRDMMDLRITQMMNKRGYYDYEIRELVDDIVYWRWKDENDDIAVVINPDFYVNASALRNTVALVLRDSPEAKHVTVLTTELHDDKKYRSVTNSTPRLYRILARQFAKDANRGISVISTATMLLSPNAHVLGPGMGSNAIKHIKSADAERFCFEEELNIEELQLIFIGDPVSQWLGANLGDIIVMHHYQDVAGIYNYRRVVPNDFNRVHDDGEAEDGDEDDD